MTIDNHPLNMDWPNLYLSTALLSALGFEEGDLQGLEVYLPVNRIWMKVEPDSILILQTAQVFIKRNTIVQKRPQGFDTLFHDDKLPHHGDLRHSVASPSFPEGYRSATRRFLSQLSDSEDEGGVVRTFKRRRKASPVRRTTLQPQDRVAALLTRPRSLSSTTSPVISSTSPTSSTATPRILSKRIPASKVSASTRATSHSTSSRASSSSNPSSSQGVSSSRYLGSLSSSGASSSKATSQASSAVSSGSADDPIVLE